MLTADDVTAVVRVHADRVHDAVRRLGCPPEAAAQVVATSALDLVDAVAADPDAVGDPVGWWFARARALGRASASGDDDLPVGGGVLGGDANQVRLAEALEARPERERAALLLRDSYDLPATAVGTVLGVDPAVAMELVGAARLAFLPQLLGGESLSLADHATDLGALARLAEGGHPAARDATTRRHVQSCTRCADALDAMERARRLLSGLTVVAMPDADREAVLASTEAHAAQVLPAALAVEEEWEDEPKRPYSLSLMALGLVAAVGIGVGAGIYLSRGSAISPTSAGAEIPLVTAAPVLTVPPLAVTPTATPSVSPSPRVFVITPSPTPTPTLTATPTPTPTITAEPLSFELSPSSGPNNTEIVVTGRGWTPGATVTVQYHAGQNNQPTSETQVVVDERGRFTATVVANDPGGLPGPHDVTGDDGRITDRATFTATL